MRTKYQSSKEVPTEVLLSRAEELADAVTRGQSGSHEFTMRIPAECDRDADLVLCELIKRFKGIQQERDALAAHVKRLKSCLETCNDAHTDYYIGAEDCYKAITQSPQTSLDEHDAEVVNAFAKTLIDYIEPYCGDDNTIEVQAVVAGIKRHADKARNGGL